MPNLFDFIYSVEGILSWVEYARQRGHSFASPFGERGEYRQECIFCKRQLYIKSTIVMDSSVLEHDCERGAIRK